MRTKKFGFTLAEGATHVGTPQINTKKGFTLAEVLITLGIIGVVAAMTIPTLISNTNSAKFKSQYKKTLSTLNQAALMATAQYDLDYASVTTACGTDGGTEKPDVTASMCALINGTLSGATYYSTASNMKIPGSNKAYSINAAPSSIADAGMTAYQLADGSVVAFNNSLASCTLAPGDDITNLDTKCLGFIDVNGPTLPNKEVACSGSAPAKASTVGNCIVRNNAADMGDIFPVAFHDGTVEPITDAARYVLNQSK